MIQNQLSLLCGASHVLEFIIAVVLVTFFWENILLLAKTHYGFLKRRSSIFQVLGPLNDRSNDIDGPDVLMHFT